MPRFVTSDLFGSGKRSKGAVLHPYSERVLNGLAPGTVLDRYRRRHFSRLDVFAGSNITADNDSLKAPQPSRIRLKDRACHSRYTCPRRRIDDDLGPYRLSPGTVGHNDAGNLPPISAKHICGIATKQKLHACLKQCFIHRALHLHRGHRRLSENLLRQR